MMEVSLCEAQPSAIRQGVIGIRFGAISSMQCVVTVCGLPTPNILRDNLRVI